MLHGLSSILIVNQAHFKLKSVEPNTLLGIVIVSKLYSVCNGSGDNLFTCKIVNKLTGESRHADFTMLIESRVQTNRYHC